LKIDSKSKSTIFELVLIKPSSKKKMHIVQHQSYPFQAFILQNLRYSLVKLQQ